MNPDIRQARSLPGPLKVVAAVTTASCLVAACTVTPLRIPPHHRVLPTGRILGVLAGPRFGVIEYAFSSRRSRGILLPENQPAHSPLMHCRGQFRFGFVLGNLLSRVEVVNQLAGAVERQLRLWRQVARHTIDA